MTPTLGRRTGSNPVGDWEIYCAQAAKPPLFGAAKGVLVGISCQKRHKTGPKRAAFVPLNGTSTGCGRSQAPTRPPPPEQPERGLKLEQTELLLADLHQGPDLPNPEGVHSFCFRSSERHGGWLLKARRDTLFEPCSI
jgi:hypothetical protein